MRVAALKLAVLMAAVPHPHPHLHHHRSRPPRGPVEASFYGPGLFGGPLYCGGKLEPGTLGVANKTLPCGTRLRICLRRCVRTLVIDRGPFVAGRTFDLTEATRDELSPGFSLGQVTWRFGWGR